MGPAKMQPALLAGVVIGVLSALPIISIGNLCCCGWVLFGGALAAYLMQQNHPAPVTVGDGAIVGLLAGIIGAVVDTALSVPLAMIMGPLQATFVQRALENARDMPPEVKEILTNMGGSAMIGIGLLVKFAFMLVAGVFFGAIGGLLGALMFRKNEPPPAPPAPPPLPPPLPL